MVVVVRLHADEQQRRVDDDDGMIFLGGNISLPLGWLL